MHNRLLILFLFLLLSPAHGQVATFDGGSIYDLDPKANQSTGNRILEQMLENDDMQPVADIARSDIIRKLAKPVGRLTLELKDGWLGRKKKGAYPAYLVGSSFTRSQNFLIALDTPPVNQCG